MITKAADREIERLMALHPKGFDLSLDRITRLLDRLGNPQDRLPPVIHIAGTNGKGSAAAFSRALLEASGYLVHVHTSPHLVNWHERYRLAARGGGRLVEDEVLAEAVARVAEANRGEAITVFEILTAVTFVLFSEHPADAAIVEVGLGGRFDATNVIDNPAVSLIMPISIDHEAYLGDRVELIAAEKAGIVKPGCPVIVGAQESETAQEVLIHTADRLGAPVTVYGQDFLAYEENGRMIYQDDSGLMDLTPPRLPGRHQYANAAAAIAAVKAAGFELSHRGRRPRHDQRRLAGPHAKADARRARRAGAARRRGLAGRWPQSGRRRGRRRGAGRAGGAQGAAAVPDRRHDQHQGPDRLFPRLQGDRTACLHRAGRLERGGRAERRAGVASGRRRAVGRAGRLGRQRADAACAIPGTAWRRRPGS